MSPDDVKNVYVRNHAGTMVPLSAVATVRWIYGSPQLQNYNGFPSHRTGRAAAPGRSTGEAMQAMEDMAAKLPAGIGHGMDRAILRRTSVRLAGADALRAFAPGCVFCLAALYESWSIPLSVILVVPLGVLGVLLAATCVVWRTMFISKSDFNYR
jgi:multidrug efflux pump